MNFIKFFLKLLYVSGYDMLRYLKYSNTLNFNGNESKLTSFIMLSCHIVEKGIVMPDMRYGFGEKKIRDLILACRLYMREYGVDNCQLKHAVSVLNEYLSIHEKCVNELPPSFHREIVSFVNSFGEVSTCENKGSKKVLFDLDSVQRMGFDGFSQSRTSLRNYSQKEIDHKDILEVVRISQTSPSACNRQSTRLHVFRKKEDIEKILSLQNGNRGFGHLAKMVIVLTNDLNVYKSEKERSMGYVDGGIYTMNLLYALHYKGIGSCVLNWGASVKQNECLHAVTNIKRNEAVAAIIACGYYPNEVDVAASVRLNPEAVVSIY